MSQQTGRAAWDQLMAKEGLGKPRKLRTKRTRSSGRMRSLSKAVRKVDAHTKSQVCMSECVSPSLHSMLFSDDVVECVCSCLRID